MAKMTKKQEKFIEEYLIDLNATQSAIRAGYSAKTAHQIGKELLKREAVAEVLELRMAEEARRTGFNQERILRELAKIAFVNIGDIVDVNTGGVKDDVLPDELAVIESVKVKKMFSKNGDPIEEREVKMASKMKALELLGKHIGMFSDKFDVNVSSAIVIGGMDELEE